MTLALRKLETDCAKNFEKYLIQRNDIKCIHWEEGENPPDCNFMIDGKNFAVEITTIMLTVHSQNKDFSNQSYQSLFKNLGEEIEQQAKSEGILDGVYVISPFGPYDDIRKAKRIITNLALQYMKDNQNVKQAKPCIIYEEGTRYCKILRLGKTKKVVKIGIGSPDYSDSYTDDAPNVAHGLLIERCQTKIEKLKNMKLPTILLLSNTFTHSEHFIEIFKMRKLDADITVFYHSIFIVEPDGNGYFVHSKEKKWLKSSQP